MQLKEIIIENIRSHKKFTFVPKEKGITAINGENGAGKSTILNAFAWSLFGTKINGQKNKELIRDGVDPKVEKVRATSIIVVGNQRYKVQRTIIDNSGTVECRVYSQSIEENSVWTFEVGPSVKYAEAYIRKVLNTDEKGFLTSTFIQQKQVDQIIDSTPKDRGQVIEKLIGVSAITEGLALGREEKRALQKAASILKTDDSLEEATEKVKKQRDLVKNLLKEAEELSENFNNIKTSSKNLQTEYDKETTLQADRDILENKLNINKEKYKLLQKQLDQQLAFVENTRLKRGRKVPIELIQENYDSMRSQISNKNIELLKYKQEYNNLKENYDSTLNLEDLESRQEELEKLKPLKDEELENLNTELILLKAKNKSNKDLVSLLEKGEGKCTLCGHPFENPKEELAKHQAELENIKYRVKALKAPYKELTNDIKSIESELSNIKDSIQKVKQQNLNKDRIKELEKNIKALSVTIDSDKAELDIITNKLLTARAEADKQKMLATAKAQIKDTEGQLKELSKLISNLEEQILDSKALSKSDYRSLGSKLKESINNRDKVSRNLYEKQHQIELEKERAKTLYNNYLACKHAHEEYKKVTDQLKVIKLSNDLLTKFKAERIKTSIPALTKIASEILAKFTNGKFVELILNEKFEAFVVTDKQIKSSINRLSGGELSAAAIALRLAIALFLSEDNENLLILDEVLVSMSEDRSESILETISSLTKSQVIFIAHNVAINQFADKVIQL